MALKSGHHPAHLIPSISIVMGGVMWGLFWIPIRAIGDLGLSGAWPGAIIYGASALLLILVFLILRPPSGRNLRALAWCGLFTGGAFSLYATSLFLTDVVRVILLFYLTPVWGTLLGVIVLAERLTWHRAVALLTGLAGLMIVLGLGEQLPWPQNAGDWMALASGMCWAYGSLRLYQMEGVSVSEQVMAFVGGSLIISALAIVFGGEVFGYMPSASTLISALPLAALTAVLVLPMLYLTIWPATILTPGRIGLLLMSEVIVGVGSAALLTGEVFGLREVLGTLLIVAAGVVEVVAPGGSKAVKPS